MVYDTYHRKYDGRIVDKYFDENEHNRRILILENSSERKRLDFTFQSLKLFGFLKVGDSIFKDRKSIYVRVKRNRLDTLIKLDFENIKGQDIYRRDNPYLSTRVGNDSED